jgi:DNA (cytosine-5)-methyltransferase 1
VKRLKDTWQMKLPYLQRGGMVRVGEKVGTFYEFFAGGGMARAGLGDAWSCLFSNDIDKKKASAYKQNWGEKELLVKDVGQVCSCELPAKADLAWASFPCQDLSLAGMGAGLGGCRSGTFWPFWKLIEKLKQEDRGPKTVVLENVGGTLTSHGGSDFRSLMEALRLGGYRCGAVIVDAALFIPQSRPRLFIIGVQSGLHIDNALMCGGPDDRFHTTSVRTAYGALPDEDKENWLWWNIPSPPRRKMSFADIIEDDVPWHRPEVTRSLLELMSPLHLAKVNAGKSFEGKLVGTVYKRTRPDKSGIKKQRAEVRFDDIAGCLRTPGGGSSRQSILAIEDGKVRSRLLSSREAARLMGLPDRYILPEKYNDAYHLMGDGVAVPVVRHLARYILEPLLLSAKEKSDQKQNARVGER